MQQMTIPLAHALDARLESVLSEHCRGFENRKSAAWLATALNTTRRSIQTALATLRLRGVPVVSSRGDGGAFIPTAIEEAEGCIREQLAAAINHIRSAHTLRKNLEREFGVDLKHIFKDQYKYPEFIFEDPNSGDQGVA